MTARLTEEQRNRIPELRSEGITVQQIARLFKVSKSCIVFWSDPEKQRARWREVTERWNRNNPERLKERSRDWRRKHATRLKTGEYISHNGEKRPYPEACELCGKNAARLIHHHWDDSVPTLGIWVCQKCHRKAEIIECPPEPLFVEKYSRLKKLIMEEAGV